MLFVAVFLLRSVLTVVLTRSKCILELVLNYLECIRNVFKRILFLAIKTIVKRRRERGRDDIDE